MILCLDIGNTHIYAGIFIDDEIKLRFRYPSVQTCTSDVLGLFLRDVLRENGFHPDDVDAISLCSVVPSLDYSVNSACRKYFNLTPLELKPGIKTGINLEVKNPLEVGADRIANAVAAVNHFPHKNIIVIDFGTATTICAINKDKAYLGGAIMPGLKVSMESLASSAAKLSTVDIVEPEHALGKSTQANIQAGIYYGQLGGIKAIIARLQETTFTKEPPVILATGGYAHLFAGKKLFSVSIPDLVLHGLRLIWEKNQ